MTIKTGRFFVTVYSNIIVTKNFFYKLNTKEQKNFLHFYMIIIFNAVLTNCDADAGEI